MGKDLVCGHVDRIVDVWRSGKEGDGRVIRSAVQVGFTPISIFPHQGGRGFAKVWLRSNDPSATLMVSEWAEAWDSSLRSEL